MPKASHVSALALLVALGALAAWTLGASGRNAETTTVDTSAGVEATTPVAATTESTPTTDAAATTSEGVTEPATDTAAATTTVQVTTTRIVTLPTLTDTTGSSSDDRTEDWD